MLKILDLILDSVYLLNRLEAAYSIQIKAFANSMNIMIKFDCALNVSINIFLVFLLHAR